MALRQPLLLLLLPLAATLATSAVQHRHCRCVLGDNRYNASEQRCTLNQENPELSYCTDESVPRISTKYEYIEPHGLFSALAIRLRYHNARAFCAQEGARLAVPKGADVFKKLSELSQRVVQMDPWLGFNDMELEGNWVDVDGNKVGALPWRKGEPNNYGDEDCAVVLKDGTLNDVYCWRERPFICERRLLRPVPAGYKWCRGGQRFYKAHLAEKTQPEARKACQQEGGSLAAPDTVEEAHCVLSVLPPYWSDSFVDFTDEQVEGDFVDSKGRRLDSMGFHLWRPGQPDNGGNHGPENCVILVDVGQYEDVPCGNTHPYVCQLVPY